MELCRRVQDTPSTHELKSPSPLEAGKASEALHDTGRINRGQLLSIKEPEKRGWPLDGTMAAFYEVLLLTRVDHTRA